jgi:heptaprenyl diphosphate synthase
MVDTGLAVSPAEAEYHRWLVPIQFQLPRQTLAPADATSEQTAAALALLCFTWDDLFDDPQLRDPEAVTALRRGLVATLRQDPETPRRPGAISTAWASLWPRLREGRSTRWQERFLDNLEEWFEAAEREAHHRINGYITSTADYLPLRRSASGTETVRAGIEVYRDRELPSKLRNHPVIRRLEELALWVIFAENDLVGLEQDEADRVPYNLVRVIRHETGCTRREAVEQVQRQLAQHRVQLEEVIRYLPTLFRMVPGLSTEYMAAICEMTSVALRVHQSDRYTRTSASAASAAPDLERLRREIYLPATEPAPTVP